MSFQTMLTPERITRETDAGFWRGRVITDFLADQGGDALEIALAEVVGVVACL